MGANFSFDSTVPNPQIVESLGHKEPWHQLVVIGNGFDLACGLPSGFASFFEARRDYFACKGPNATDPKFTETLWDHILEKAGKDNWCDVEGAIAKWVAPKIPQSNAGQTPAIATGTTPLGKMLGKLEGYQCSGSDAICDKSAPEYEVAFYIHGTCLPEHGTWTERQLLNLMQKELHILEEDFSRYLQEAISKNSNYHQASYKLMHDLLYYELADSRNYDVEASVLSFNYTRPLKPCGFASAPIPYVNIHGQLGGEIIFGIDGTDHMNDPVVLPFTKTYRLMALDVPNACSIVRGGSAGAGIGATNVIKFYGHSLGKADYSYFQAIFDTVNLYTSKTQLLFFTQPFGGKDAAAVKHEMMDKAIVLLSAYGKTLDNKDHGKNLIHKLLIEGRLKVIVL